MEADRAQSPLAAGPTLEVKYYYTKRSSLTDAPEGKLSPTLARQTLTQISASTLSAPDAWRNDTAGLSPPVPSATCTLLLDEFEVGGFYEIDHEQLPPKSPIHLKDIRVVKVVERTRLNVIVSFPSAFSLRKHLAEVNPPNVGSTARVQLHPDLDEQFVMGFSNAGRILRRLIPSSEVKREMHLERFWSLSYKSQGNNETPELRSAITLEEDREELEDKDPVNSCLLALKSAELVQWGVRRKVKYIGRHREQDYSALVAAVKEEGTTGEGQVHANIGVNRMRELGKKRKKKDDWRFKKIKRFNGGRSDRKAFKATKDRWSSERYEAAELKLLEIMKLKGAVLGNPILRPELREEARKHIGDTGLLDHLLKHMAGKVVAEGGERFRRRHNPEGAMEYWLEPAELQDMRRSAGVMDPFWLPPSGWNPGDPISPYGVATARDIDHLKEELASIRRDVESLRSHKLQQEAKDAQSRTDAASLLKLQESYESLMKSNANLKEQVTAMSTCLQELQVKRAITPQLPPPGDDNLMLVPDLSDANAFLKKDEIRLLKLDKEKSEAVQWTEKGAKVADVVDGDGSHDENPSDTTTNTAGMGTSANDVANDSRNGTNNISEGTQGRTVRRSGFRICKPAGTFLWPNMGSNCSGICSPNDPHPSCSASGGNDSSATPCGAAFSAEDPCGVPPTPRSASSATSPPGRVSPAAAPRAQVVVVVPRPQQLERLGFGERADSSDNICIASLPSHIMRASSSAQYDANLEKRDFSLDGCCGGISTDLALSSSSCYR